MSSLLRSAEQHFYSPLAQQMRYYFCMDPKFTDALSQEKIAALPQALSKMLVGGGLGALSGRALARASDSGGLRSVLDPQYQGRKDRRGMLLGGALGALGGAGVHLLGNSALKTLARRSPNVLPARATTDFVDVL